MTEQEQIDALKAQVNCLRSVITDFRDGRGVLEPIETVLSKAPEQCLAEVKAKAIEEMITEFSKNYFLGTSLNRKVEDYTKQLREQAK